MIKIKTVSTIKIEKTTNEILFKPMGNMIPELSWATLRIHMNISNMFSETEDLCKTAHLMWQEEKKLIDKYGVNVDPKNSMT